MTRASSTYHATPDIHLLQLRHPAIPCSHGDFAQSNVERVLGYLLCK